MCLPPSLSALIPGTLNRIPTYAQPCIYSIYIYTVYTSIQYTGWRISKGTIQNYFADIVWASVNGACMRVLSALFEFLSVFRIDFAYQIICFA